ncbi:transcriptional regulator, partial [Micrococcus endophyticus]
GGRVPVRVAINADSLDTWWDPVLREAATWDDVVLQLRTEDQEHTAALLRDGTVVAAVTDDPTPVSGCTSTPLGTMRYHAVCASFLLEMHRDERGRLDLAALPRVDYGLRDGLQ